ncbi:MAG: hypothetical protein HYS13_24775 [Planctomycetia bacterium]|nr:hypothetical protein [Planctomycetia bacterium]
MIGLVVGLLLAGAAYAIWWYRARSQFDDAVAAARQRGEPVWFVDLEPPPISPEQDGGPLYVRAVSLLHPRTTRDSLRKLLERVIEKAKQGGVAAIPASDMEQLANEVDRNHAALKIVDEAILKPHCRIPRNYHSPDPMLEDETLTLAIANIGMLMSADFLLALRSGDIARAAARIEDRYELAHALRGEVTAIAYLSRLGLCNTATRDLALLVGHADLTPGQFRSFDQWLVTSAEETKSSRTILAERAAGLTLWQDVNRERAPFWYRFSFMRPLHLQDRAEFLERTTKLAEGADATGPDRPSVQIDSAIKKGASDAIIPTRPMTWTGLPGLIAITDVGLLNRQVLLNGRFGIRVARSFRESGRLPMKLEEVHDDEFKEVPLVLRTGLPLKLESVEGGFRIWSINDGALRDQSRGAFEVRFLAGSGDL